jgi:hypothetical protein
MPSRLEIDRDSDGVRAMSQAPVHATFENAWRLAATMADANDKELAVVRTGDPSRPFVVDEDVAHRDAVAVIVIASRPSARHSLSSREAVYQPCPSGTNDVYTLSVSKERSHA